MTFDKVDTMTAQPRRSDNNPGHKYCVNGFQKSTIVLVIDFSSIIYQLICTKPKQSSGRFFFCISMVACRQYFCHLGLQNNVNFKEGVAIGSQKYTVQ